MQAPQELRRFHFPCEKDDFHEESDDTIFETIRSFKNGIIFFARIDNQKTEQSQYACCTKTQNVVFVTYQNGEIEEILIDEKDKIQEIHLLSSYIFPTLQLSLFPIPKHKHLVLIPHWINSSELRILILKDSVKVAEIQFRALCNSIFIETLELSNKGKEEIIVHKETMCNIQIEFIELKKMQFTLQFTNKINKEEIITFDISDFIEDISEKSEKESISTNSRGIFVTNIVDAFIIAKSDKKQEILHKISSLLNKYQTDPLKRLIGLESLQKIYKSNSGSFDIINRLWKTCKESFEIQPYNIIDIKELTLSKIELGHGTFGSVQTGIWNSPNGKIPVAVKIIQENSQMFDLSDLRGEVCFFFVFLFVTN